MPQRPNCDCHGEPQWRHSDPRKKGRFHWRCAVKERERSRRRYWADPIAGARRKEDRARQKRINRFENELKELLDA